MRIDFYQIKIKPFDFVLPSLLEKVLAAGHKVLVKTDSEAQTKYIDDLLWTYNADKWLPHGTEKDGNEASQPVFLSDSNNCDKDNPNGADVLVLLGADKDIKLSDLAVYKRVLLLFDESEINTVNARLIWKQAESEEIEKNYQTV